MKRNDAEQIGKLIRTFLRQESLSRHSMSSGSLTHGQKSLAPLLPLIPSELYIRNQILYVHLTSAALRQGTDDGT